MFDDARCRWAYRLSVAAIPLPERHALPLPSGNILGGGPTRGGGQVPRRHKRKRELVCLVLCKIIHNVLHYG